MSSIGASLSGLKADQYMLDVIGNNLANANTDGFKSSRVTFSAMMSQTLQQASAGTSTAGSSNPVQIGLGVNIGTVTRDFSQGALSETGNSLDLAIDGAGFFALDNGTGTVFTPSAGFSVDSNNQIVDSQTGYHLLSTNNSAITIPYNEQVPAQMTTAVTLAGNLSVGSTLPQTEVLSTTVAFATASGAATASTDLSALSTTSTAYADGDTIVISGSDAAGNALTPVNFTYGAANDGTTLGALVTKINAAYAGQATAALDASGNLTLTASTAGAASLSLTLAAGSGTGVTDWTQNALAVSTAGVAGGTYQLSSNIYDSLGNSHTLTLAFTRTSEREWDMTASLGDAQGTLTTSTVSGILFNTDGSFNSVSGGGSGAQQIAINYGTAAAPQTISLAFGSSGGFNGLTFFGGNSTAAATKQDGYSSGTLSSFNIGSDGTIQGVYSNGVNRNLAQIQTATFANPNGLLDLGKGCWGATPSSGSAVLGAATSSSTGSIVSGSTEASNVDTAQELSRLIIAQNGYQLNAKAMSVSDQVIQQLTQNI
jgi:flagellar hook protein FlgE